jgi:hypothetical protein
VIAYIVDFAVTLLLAGHLLCMNLASALPLFAVLLQWQARRHDDVAAAQQARTLSWLSIGTLLLGTLVGLLVAGLMWVQHDRSLFQVLPRFERKIWWGLGELVFYLICLAIYIALNRSPTRSHRAIWVTQFILALAAATNLLYHFPPLFAVMVWVSHEPGLAADYVTVDEFRQLVFTGKVMSLTGHFWLASFAVAAIFVAHRAVRARSQSESPRILSSVARFSIRVALATSGLQVLVGTWVLVQIGPVPQHRLLGGNWLSTLLLALAVVSVFVLLRQLAELSFVEPELQTTRRALLWMVVVVVLMTAAIREAERTIRPDPEVSLSQNSRWSSNGGEVGRAHFEEDIHRRAARARRPDGRASHLGGDGETNSDGSFECDELRQQAARMQPLSAMSTVPTHRRKSRCVNELAHGDGSPTISGRRMGCRSSRVLLTACPQSL